MAETQRTVSETYTLLADNTSGNISPQDLRDGFETWRIGHGQIAVSASDAAAITISDTVSYFEVTNPVWTVGGALHNFDESGGNGRLTYTGVADTVVHIACSISMTSGSNNQTLHWRIGLTGVTDATSEVQRRIMTGTDVGSTALHLITTMSTNDYLSLWVRNATGANNVTLEVGNLQAMAMAD
jgi:hypothetical protein